jgi:hypothetical protein
MQTITLLNLAANSLLICSSIHLLYKIFGSKNSRVWQKPHMAMLYKAVMGITICGAAANIITLSTPTWSEVVLNLGASGNWLFLSFYMYGYTSYTRDSSSRSEVHKRNSSGGANRVAKTKQDIAPSSKRGKRVAT